MPLRSQHRPTVRLARALLLALAFALGLGATAGARAQSLQALFDAAAMPTTSRIKFARRIRWFPRRPNSAKPRICR